MQGCMIDLDLLRSFLAVHRTGSLSAAAHVVGKSQPALSRQLQALEARYQRALFTRVGRGLRATPAGDELARAIAGPIDALVLACEAHEPAATTGTVHIGGPIEVLSAWALPALAPLIASGLSVNVKVLPSEAALEAVARGELDVVVSSGRRRPGLQLAPLFAERLVLIASAGRGRTLAAEVRERGGEALTHTPLLAWDDGLPLFRRYWKEAFQTRVAGRPSVVVPDLRALLTMVERDAGITVIPSWLVGSAEVTIVHKAALPVENVLYAATMKQMVPRAAAVVAAWMRTAPPRG